MEDNAKPSGIGGAMIDQGEGSGEARDMTPREIIHTLVDDIISDGADPSILLKALHNFAPGLVDEQPKDKNERAFRTETIGTLAMIYPHLKGEILIKMYDASAAFCNMHRISPLKLAKIIRIIGKLSDAGIEPGSITATLKDRYSYVSLET